MKKFFLGVLLGSVLVGGVSYYLYQNNPKIETQTVLVKSQQVATEGDSNTLSANLVNRQIEELSALKGEEFDAQYIMILHTATSGIKSVADIAQKQASDPMVKSMAGRVQNESSLLVEDLSGLRSKYNLIHD